MQLALRSCATTLAPTGNPLTRPARESAPNASKRSAGAVEREMDAMPHVEGDLKRLTAEKHRVADARQAEDATKLIEGDLPGEGESLHLLVSGRFSLWDMVPAVMKIANESIDTLHIATLGFSKRNVDAICGLIDAKSLSRVTLLCSHYFKGTSQPIYAHAIERFATRPEARFVSCRTHAKLLLIKTEARTITVESSANLRSCRNIENMTLFGGYDVYRFHQQWIDDLATELDTK